MTVYVSHTCKNTQCGKGFLAEDTHNAQYYAPKTKYCDECKAQGFEDTKSERGKRGAEQLKKYWEDRKKAEQEGN